MDRVEKTNEKVEELFHQPAAGEGGSDGEFMQILQRYIFGGHYAGETAQSQESRLRLAT